MLNRKTVDPEAASCEMARQIDEVQTAAGEGPCLDSIYEETTVRVHDMGSESRWPDFAQRAFELGTGSMLSFQLYVEGDTLGALNLFARQPHAFGERSENVGLLFSARAAVAFAGIQLQQELSKALGQATPRRPNLRNRPQP